MAKPASIGQQAVRYGGGGICYIEERNSDGSVLAAPDTWGALSLTGPAKFGRKGIQPSKRILVSTNAVNQSMYAVASYLSQQNLLQTSAPDIVVTLDALESTPDMLNFYTYCVGRYFNLLIPMAYQATASNTQKWVDWFGFGQFTDGGDVTLDENKNTAVPLTFTVMTNTVSDTVASLVALNGATPKLVYATAATIAAYAGEIRVAT